MRWVRPRVALVGVALALLTASPSVAATSVSLTSGAVTATLTSSGGLRSPAPIVLSLTRADVTTVFDDLETNPSGSPNPHAATLPGTWTVFPDRPLILADLDADGETEVIVRLFSGGAHCCELTFVASYEPTTGGYARVTQGFGDASWVLRDVGATGVPKFESWDFRWAYWGGVYAGSPEPVQVWSFAGGAFTDVTRQFPAAIRRDQRAQLAFSARERRTGGNYRGALAAYVADAYSLGTPDPAWRRIYAAYRERDRVRFFHALRNQLANLGYRAATDPTPRVTGSIRRR